jgi:hypothetical protein
MAHTTEIVEIKEINDTQVAYRVRCCGEPMTDSWHTAAVDAPNLETELQAHRDRVAALHEAKVQWRKKNPVK